MEEITKTALETAPTSKQIDQLIAKYATALLEAASAGQVAKVASDAAGEIKTSLTAMVEKWGHRHTEKSKRLEGLHNRATTTTGTKTSIDDEAVDKLRAFLGKTETPANVEDFFTAHTSYSLVSAPDEKLKTLTMGTRIRTKITGLLKGCFKITPNTPSLKVELAEVKTV